MPLLPVMQKMAIAATVVVTQTLVEVSGMIAYVRLVPRLVRDPATAAPDREETNAS